jgi:hypothetical protein
MQCLYATFAYQHSFKKARWLLRGCVADHTIHQRVGQILCLVSKDHELPYPGCSPVKACRHMQRIEIPAFSLVASAPVL